MFYTFLSAVFLTLFLMIGGLALYGFFELWFIKNFPLTWACYQHVIVLGLISMLCFIAACLFGTQIPACYVS